MKKPLSHSFTSWCGVVVGVSACNSVTGLNDFSVKDGATGGTSATSGGTSSTGGDSGAGGDATVPECTTNQECTQKATAAAASGQTVAAVCVKPEGRCASLLSEACTTLTGDYKNDDTIIIGSLFSTVGAQSAANIQRQQSAMLAVQQINAVGGIPPATSGGGARKLLLVSCDESTNLVRATGHLVDDLNVPAIVGPNTSQDTLDISNQFTIAGDTVVMSPTAVASNIAALIDNDLTWLMVPNDFQRAPLMIDQINELETKLKAERMATTMKLGIVFRDDALGRGTRVGRVEVDMRVPAQDGRWIMALHGSQYARRDLG